MKKSILLAAVVLLALPFFVAGQETPRLDVTLMSCTELQCTNQKDVFSVNESAYIDYNSSVKGISYSAILAFPDGSKYQIMLPNRIASNFTGNYTLELIAWKDGYEETRVTKVIQFVEELPGSKPSNPPAVDIIRLFLVIIVAVLIIAVVWRLAIRNRKPKKAETSKEKKR